MERLAAILMTLLLAGPHLDSIPPTLSGLDTPLSLWHTWLSNYLSRYLLSCHVLARSKI